MTSSTRRARSVVVVLLVSSACAPERVAPSAPQAVPATPAVPAAPATTSVAMEASAPRWATDPGVVAAVSDYVARPTTETGVALVEAIERSRDPRLVAYLVDFLRVGPSSKVEERSLAAIGPLTGLADPGPTAVAYLRVGRWLLEHPFDPGPEYPAFKAAVYRSVEPAFAAVFARVADRSLLAQLQWGGVPFGGIRELNNPPRRRIAELGWLDRVQPDELLLATTVGGLPVAYPVRILGRHELANDTLGGLPVALAYCTLCRSAMLFDRRVDGQVLEFQTSGLLLESNKVMVDRQTGSLWRQLSGEAIAGPLQGRRLSVLAVETTTWAQWTTAQPTTEVLELPEPWLANGPDGPVLASYLYAPDAVQPGYYASDQLWYPTRAVPGSLAPKDEIVGIEIGGGALAVQLEALRARGPVALAVGEATAVVVPSPGGARVYDGTRAGLAGGSAVDVISAPPGTDEPAVLADGRRLARLAVTQSFWFAWFATHPATSWWPPG